MDALARRVCAVDQANRALGHEVFAAAGATFVRSRALPRIHDANHVALVRVGAPAEIDALLACVDAEFAHCRHRQFVLDAETPPPVEARLVLDGYVPSATVMLVLEGAMPPPAPGVAIRAVVTDADWDAYGRLKRLDWQETCARLGLGDLPDVGDGLVASYRMKVPPLRYWLVVADGAPRGFVSSWEGAGDGMGQVEDLFVERAYRRRGLATALVRHAVADCRARGAGPVAIAADATDTPKRMYAAMGFRPVAVLRKYTRH
jgi:GNAT superfamily N-acetyltransferase